MDRDNLSDKLALERALTDGAHRRARAADRMLLAEANASLERLARAEAAEAEVQALKAELEAAREENRWAYVQAAMDDRKTDAEAEVARLRDALTLIERVYYMEARTAEWRAANMNGIARCAQDGKDLAQYKRLFPRAALQPKAAP